MYDLHDYDFPIDPQEDYWRDYIAYDEEYTAEVREFHDNETLSDFHEDLEAAWERCFAEGDQKDMPSLQDFMGFKFSRTPVIIDDESDQDIPF